MTLVSVMGVLSDAAKPADVDKLYARVREHTGKLDIVFANAGIGEESNSLWMVVGLRFSCGALKSRTEYTRLLFTDCYDAGRLNSINKNDHFPDIAAGARWIR